jgi:hypothetical protein
MNRKQRRAAKSQGKAAPGFHAPARPAGSSVQIAKQVAMVPKPDFAEAYNSLGAVLLI